MIGTDDVSLMLTLVDNFNMDFCQQSSIIILSMNEEKLDRSITLINLKIEIILQHHEYAYKLNDYHVGCSSNLR